MSAFRSHYFSRSTPQPTPDVQRKQSSRTPTNQTGNDTESKSKAAQHVSKLAKRASRGITPSEKAEHGTRSTSARAPSSVTAAHNPSAPRRAPVVPRSEDVGSTHRHDLSLPTAPPPTIRTPSLVSGSSASTFDSPRSNVLRKKPSNIQRYAAQKRTDAAPTELDRATMQSKDDGYQAAFDDAVLGISLPPTSTISASESGREWHVFRDITPPTVSAYAPSLTPSTRYTDSPFSHAPTPSSTSSYSPAVIVTSGASGRAGAHSPLRSRPAVTRRTSDKHDASRLGLPPVRESSTSSSNSTVKASASTRTIPRKDVPRKSPSAPPATTRSNLTTNTVSNAMPSAAAPSSQNAKPPIQIPPELAHLNVDPKPLKLSLDKPLPPLRPSRDNTPSLSDMRQQTRVVQSDLPPLYTTYHKRTPSQETPNSASSPGFRQRLGFSPKVSSRQPSPRVDSAISPPPLARNFARKPTPEPPQSGMARLQRTDSPAIGPGPSPSKSPRFAFFSRSKSRADAEKPVEKPKRQPNKGPVAGTGHEGYGRFGFRGRSGSTTSSAGFRSPSTGSNASSIARPTNGRKASMCSDSSELEDFLRERQKPVILRGSGSTFSNTTSTSDVQPASTVTSSNSSSIDSFPKPQLLPSAMHADRGLSPAKRPPLRKRLPSDSSDEDVAPQHSRLAARRSMNKLSQADAKSQVRIPASIDTNVPLKRPPMSSYDADTSAWPQTDSTLPGADNPTNYEGYVWSPPEDPETAKPSRKWNFFQRAHASPRPKGKQKAASYCEQVQSPTSRTTHGAGTHYALLEPVEPVDDLYEVEQILQENDPSAEESMAEELHTARLVPYESRHSSLLPSPPRMELKGKAAEFKARPAPPRITVRTDSAESPELLRAQAAIPQQPPRVVDIPTSPSKTQPGVPYVGHQHHTPRLAHGQNTPEMSSEPFATPDKSADNSPRQPRLSPVGRIPRVVSKRDRDRKLPDNSFSRPFARTQPNPSVKPPGALYTQIRELASPIESGSQPASSTSARSDGTSTGQKTSTNTQPTSVSETRNSTEVPTPNEFTTFAPRKDSQVSYSSSSGNGSWTAAVTALPPQMDDPWTEYNDLLDDMMPQKTPISAGSSLGAPFQYSSVLYDAHDPYPPTPLLYLQPPPSVELPQIPRSQTVPAVLSVPQQIARFMHPSMSPMISPHTLSELYDDYGSRSSAHLTPKRASLPQPAPGGVPPPTRSSLPNSRTSIASSRYSRASSHSRTASLPEANARNSRSSLTPSARFRRDTQLLDIAEDESDANAAHANLRFGALVTSRWLSFGRVLFSPAHNEMRLADDPKVLVLDGLGSDWSYYVAQSYPQASVFNLGLPTSGIATSWPGVSQGPPRNHKQCQLSSISAVFPFPKGYFTAVVFRFPIAATDTAYQECIQECKRVLRPGGHLEVAALDLDLVNMGAKARSLVRGLKTRLNQHDRSVSLRNSSDFLVQLMGRRGFEDVQRCVVGVPAAGRIPRSRDISSRNSGDSSRRKESSSGSEKELSFATLLASSHDDQSEASSKSNDEGITKMVAKVGRWWYSSCYEAPLLATDKSIWSDPGLLRECEKQGTSFRLLLCHAQKPAQTRRRTVSV